MLSAYNSISLQAAVVTPSQQGPRAENQEPLHFAWEKLPHQCRLSNANVAHYKLLPDEVEMSLSARAAITPKAVQQVCVCVCVFAYLRKR